MHVLVAIAAFMLGVWPAGIFPGVTVSGVSPAVNAAGCCWLAPRADMSVPRPAGSDALLLRIGIPTYAAASGGTSLVVRIGSGAAQRRCCYGAGEHEAVFALPPGRNSPLGVHIEAEPSFVPAERGVGPDRRTLTVLLHSVEPFVRREGFAPRGSPLLLALLLLAGCAVAFGAARLPCVAWIALLASDPYAFSYGAGATTVTLPKVVLLGAFIGLFARRDARAALCEMRAFPWILVPLAAFLGSMLLSDIGAEHHEAALRETLRALQYAVTFIVAFVAYRLQGNDARALATIAVTTIGVSASALGGMFSNASEHTLIAGHAVARAAGPLEGPNQLAAFLGLALPLLASRAFTRKPARLEIAAFVLGALALALTISRAGAVCAVLALTLFFLLRARPHVLEKTLAAYGFGWVCFFLATIAASQGVRPFVRLFGGNADPYAGGLGNRAELWSGAVTMWRAHPWLGVGPGNYESHIGALFAGVWTHANGYYLHVLAEQGLVGEISLLALTCGVIAALARGVARPLVLGVFVAFLGFAAHQLADGFLMYPKVGVFLWTLVGMGLASLPEVLKKRSRGTSKPVKQS